MPLGHIRRFLVGLRDALDGRFHPARKARATARLRGLRPQTVLFLCLGNVCRSPYGARVLSERARHLRVESAGFIGPNRPPPDAAQEVARARGMDHGDHRSRVVTTELLGGADAVFVFDRFNVARLRKHGGVTPDRVFWLGDFDPAWSGKRAIIDPWGKSAKDFDETFARIERCIDEVLNALERGSSANGP